MNKSDSIGALAAALSKAQAVFPTIPKDKEVLVKSDKGGYKFSYAPLESITSAIRPALKANGLAFTQSVSGDSLTTMILHESGEWIQSDPIPVKVASGSAQALGSGITYARRYSLVCAFGIVADEDDDGNAADGNHVEQAKAEPPQRESKPITPNDAGKEFWDKADPQEKEFLQLCVSTIRDFLNVPDPDKASKHFYSIGSIEEQAAVWSRLSAPERKIVKIHKQETK